MSSLSETLLRLRSACAQRRAVRAAEAKVAGEQDREAAEAQEEAENADAALSHTVIEALGSLFRTHSCAALPSFNSVCAGEVMSWLEPGRPSNDRRLALYLSVDLLEFCGQAAADGSGRSWAEALLPVLLAETHSERADARQCVAYGLAAAAASCGAAFARHAPAALAALAQLIQRSSARPDSAHDNAVKALAHMARYQLAPGSSERRTALALLLSRCPLKEDPQEAAAVTRMLARWLQAGDPDLLVSSSSSAGPEPALLASCIKALLQGVQQNSAAAARAGGSDGSGLAACVRALSANLVLQDVKAALQALQAGMPQQLLQSAWALLSRAEQSALQSFAQ
jgi:hypothetical protein